MSSYILTLRVDTLTYLLKTERKGCQSIRQTEITHLLNQAAAEMWPFVKGQLFQSSETKTESFNGVEVLTSGGVIESLCPPSFTRVSILVLICW